MHPANEAQTRCYFKLRVDGLECFIYNRSSAYDVVEDLLLGKNKKPTSTTPESVNVLAQTKNNPMFYCPFELTGTTGSILIGNPDLPSILTIAYKEIHAIYTSTTLQHNTATPILKDNLQMQLKSFLVTIRLNVDYKEATLNYASRLRVLTEPVHWTRKIQSFFFPKPSSDTGISMSHPYQWEGLQRFREANDTHSASKLEYAQSSQIVDSSLVNLKYYTKQIGGLVRSRECDLDFLNAKIVYGPWAQRQRHIIQSFYSPPSYRDAPLVQPKSALESKVLSINLDFRGNSTLKIPTREPSKDAEFLRTENPDLVFESGVGNPGKRPYGWITAEFKSGSALSLNIPLFAETNGSITKFDLLLSNVTLKTSVNFKPFIVGKQILIEVAICSPLSWNGLREWDISLKWTDCDVYLLREHIGLVTDMIKDLNSLPPPSIEYHVPSVYTLNFKFQNLKILFCLNPMNIIKNHNSIDSNDYLTLTTHHGALKVNLSFEEFEPDFRKVDISGDLHNVAFVASFSEGHKLKLFLKSPFNTVLSSSLLNITASYIYRKLAAGARDALTLLIESKESNVNAHGHILPTVMSFLRNYFGDAARSSTPESYSLAKLLQPQTLPPRNAFELHFQWRFNGVSLLLPCSIYGASDSIAIKGNYIHLDLHNKVDGQDIHVTLSPLTMFWKKTSIMIRDTQLHIQRFSTGMPRHDLLLSSWNICIDDILGDLEPKFVGKFSDAIQSFIYNMGCVHPLVREYTDARTDSRSASVMELTVRNIELCLRLDRVLTRLLLPQGLIAHMNNCVFIEGDLTRFVHIPALIISSLQLPDMVRQTRVRNDYAAEVFRLETSVIIENKWAFADAEATSASQYKFLLDGDIETGGRLWAFLNRARKDIFGSPPIPPTFNLRMPLFFQKGFTEDPQASLIPLEFQADVILNRVPPSLSSIHYAEHLSIYDTESYLSTSSSSNSLWVSQETLNLVKRSCTPILNIPPPAETHRLRSMSRALPNENRLSIKFRNKSLLVLTPLSLKSVLHAVQSLTSDQSSESTGDFAHILDIFQRQHIQRASPVSFLNIYSVLFSTINIRLISSLPNDRRTACIIDIVLQSFSGFAKVKKQEIVPGQIDLRLGSVDCSLRIKENQQFQYHQIPGIPDSVWEGGDIWHNISDPIGLYFSLKDINLTFEIGTSSRNVMNVKSFEIEAVDAIVDVLIMQAQLWFGFAHQLQNDFKELMRMPTNLMQQFLFMISIFQETNELSSVSGPAYFIQNGFVEADDDVGLLLLYSRIVWDLVRTSKRFDYVRTKAPELLAVSEGNLDTLCSNILRKWGHSPCDSYPMWFLRLLDPSSFVSSSTAHQQLPLGESRLLAVIHSANLFIYDESGESNCIKLKNIGVQPRLRNVILPFDPALQLSSVVVELAAITTLDSLEMTIYPNFISFILRSLKDWRKHLAPSADSLSSSSISATLSPATFEQTSTIIAGQNRSISFSGLLRVNSIVVAVQEKNAEARLLMNGITMSLHSGHNSLEMTSSIPHLLEYSFNAGICSTSLQLFERVVLGAEVQLDNIFSLSLFDAQMNLAHTRVPSNDSVACVKFNKVAIRLPRSLIKIQTFFEKLKAEDIPRYSHAFREASIMPKSPILTQETPHFVAKKRLLDVFFAHVSIESELLTNFRFSYDLRNTTVSVLHQGFSKLMSKATFIYRIDKQEVRFLPPEANDITLQPILDTLPLPASFSTGSILYNRADATSAWNSFFSGNVVLENINAELNIDIVDKLLTTYSVLPSELSEVVRVMSFYTNQRRYVPHSGQYSRLAPSEPVKGVTKYAIKVTVKEIMLSVNDPSSSVLIGSSLLDGYITNNTPNSSTSRLLWSVAADNLTISLAQRSPNFFQQTVASVMIDLNVQNWRDVTNDIGVYSVENMYDVVLRKVHALMQPIAVGKIVDVITFWQSALRRRSNARQESLSEIRLDTKSVLESLKMGLPESIDQPSTSAILARPIKLTLNNFSILVPIIDDFDLQHDWKNFKSTDQAEAVLLHLESAVINRNGSISCAEISQLSITFISNFNPSNEHDFNPNNHFSQNKSILPLIRVNITHSTTIEKTSVEIDSHINGFTIELDSSISKKISMLGNIYKRGKQTIYASFPQSADGDIKKLQVLGKTVGRIESALLDTTVNGGILRNRSSNPYLSKTSDPFDVSSIMQVKGLFEFASGNIIVRNIPQTSRSMHASQQYIPANANIELDTLLIPGLTLTLTGATTTNPQSLLNDKSAPCGLHMELTIHPSENILSPSIVGFFEDLISNIQHPTQRRDNATMASETTTSASESSDGIANPLSINTANTKAFRPFASAHAADELESAAKMQWNAGYTGSANYKQLGITFLLKLSQTRVNLSCQPYAKVICTLQLEKADFLFSLTPKGHIVPGRRFLSCTSNIKSLRASLRHVFSSEDCIRNEIPNITFSSTIDHTIGKGFAFLSTFTIPHISANVNMRQLQDMFMFLLLWKKKSHKAASGGNSREEANYTSAKTKPEQHGRATIQDSLAVALVVGKIDITVEMGSSIGRATFALKNLNTGLDLVWRGVSPISRIAHIGISSILLSMEGRLVGSMSFQNAKGFAQCIDSQDSQTGAAGTNASFFVECAIANLQYQNERILILEVLSTAIVFGDALQDSQLDLNLDILIQSIKFVVSRHAAPRCIQLIRRITTSIKDKATMAKMQLANMTTRHSDLSTRFTSTSISQPRTMFNLPKFQGLVELKMRIRCSTCFGTATRNSFRDPDCAQIYLSGLDITLFEIPMLLEKISETTTFTIGKLNIKKLSLKAVSQAEERMWTMAQWFTFLGAANGSDVLQFPTLSMRVTSESDLIKNRVEYGFRTDFQGRVYVALNIGLYKYLLDLIKTYSKAALVFEMEDDVIPQAHLEPRLTLKIGSPSPSQSNGSQHHEFVSPSPMASTPMSNQSSFVRASQQLLPSRPKPVLIRTGELVFEPQLQVTGDATPTELIEKLGIRKEDIPRLMYSSITLEFSGFIHQICKVYKSLAIFSDEDGFLSTIESLNSPTSSGDPFSM
ncbi:Macrophage colony-stimulating factor 1 receptor [Batrachochytrium dendrobatidis]|nr:Macrophage colony-stimulating factor 1 receptor [Batrachochytrium dendrobatidis]